MNEQYLQVKNKVEVALRSSNREEDACTLIAVSKTKPVEMLMEVYEAGCRHFGENKVQELMDKYDKMPSDVKWHMIGHLQTNKVKYIVDKVEMIHSVDTVKLAECISKEAMKKNIIVPILLEVNLAEEESKFGFLESEVLGAVEAISKLPGVKLSGLMTVPPFVEEGEENRVYFKKLTQISVDILSKNMDNVCMDILSMGMTSDYEVAVSEGATFVRVGSAIFGNRIYN